MVLIAVNVIFVPRYGYIACAWAGCAGYGTAMLLSYFVGQRKYPIDYPLRSIFGYTLLAAAIFTAYQLLPPMAIVTGAAVKSLGLLIFLAAIVRTEHLHLPSRHSR